MTLLRALLVPAALVMPFLGPAGLPVESSSASCAARPSAADPRIQIEAPSENVASTTLLDRPVPPQVFSIALDQPIGDPDGGRAITTRFTPSSILALVGIDSRREAGVDKSQGALARMGMSASMGGPTQADDRDSRRRRRTPTDHMTTELKLCLFDDVGAGEAAAPHPTRGPLDAASLSVTADTYDTGFGRDLYAAALLAETHRPRGGILNLAYRREEKIHDPRREELKLAAGIDRTAFRIGGRPVSLTLSGEELVRNLGRNRILQGNAKCDFQVTDRARFTAAMTCANRVERYAEGTTRGSLGLSWLLR